MSIACSSFGTGMAKKGLDMAKAQAAFKEMSCECMAKGVNRDFFLMLHSLTTVFIAFWVPPIFIWVVAC